MADVSRRDVLKGAAGLVGVAVSGTLPLGGGQGEGPTEEVLSKEMQNKAKFTLKYAPHFGMFGNHAGNDPVDQLKFAADEGFHAWEDNGMKGPLGGASRADRRGDGAARHHDGRVRGEHD